MAHDAVERQFGLVLVSYEVSSCSHGGAGRQATERDERVWCATRLHSEAGSGVHEDEDEAVERKKTEIPAQHNSGNDEQFVVYNPPERRN